MISAVVPIAMVLVKTQPTLDLIIFGLYKSVLGLAIKTASKSAASAVRNNAPIFPGFSGASATNINGLSLFSFIADNVCCFDFIMAIIPSVVSLYATFL